MLSIALAFLIIPPGMIVTVEAQSFEGIYLPQPIDSIAPDLEGEDYVLYPFHAGRPLYNDGDRMTAACGGICWLIVSFIGGNIGNWALTRMKTSLWWAWQNLTLSQYGVKEKFEQWVQAGNYVEVAGQNHCGTLANTDEHAPCLRKWWVNFIKAFVKRANRCSRGFRLKTTIYEFKPKPQDDKVWSCYRHTEGRNRWGQWWRTEVYFEWDARGYLQ